MSIDSNIPWVEKYRPNSLEDIKSHGDIIHTIKNFIKQDEFPDLLLYGPPGTGKTSTILCCCREMYGPSYQTMVIHLNASDERGIEVVRQRIRDFSRARTFLQTGKYKLVVLDEADAMTEEAQAALRQVIYQSRHNTRYCLICNYVTKIIPSLRSRFVILRYSPLEPGQLTALLINISEREKITLDQSAIDAIIHISNGDARKSINLLQSCSYYEWREESVYTITDDEIFQVSSKPPPKYFHQQIYNLLHLPLTESIKSLQDWFLESGISLLDFIQLISTQVIQYGLPDKILEFLIPMLSDIEHHLCFSNTTSIQLQAIASIFHQARKVEMLL